MEQRLTVQEADPPRQFGNHSSRIGEAKRQVDDNPTPLNPFTEVPDEPIPADRYWIADIKAPSDRDRVDRGPDHAINQVLDVEKAAIYIAAVYGEHEPAAEFITDTTNELASWPDHVRRPQDHDR